MRFAFVHDWLTGMRGGERCLEAFAQRVPDAPILTLFHEPGSVGTFLDGRRIVTSPLSRAPFLRRNYRRLLPLFPWAVATLPGREFDGLLSLSHCAAKAIGRRPGARHVCYCFTPARYLWDHVDTYLGPGRAGFPTRLAAQALLPELRRWDLTTAASVDRFIAISDYVARRIRRIYGREADVIYPPVDVARFCPAPPAEIGDHYLMVTALAPYKGVDLAIRAFRRVGRKLVIIGRGEEERRLRALAGPNVEFRGWIPDAEVSLELARCRGFLLPCEEDFGIAPLEAMASGRPVLALGRGGALETVVVGGSTPTGVFFEDPNEDSLIAGLAALEADHDHFDPVGIRQHALAFDLPIFRRRIAALLEEEFDFSFPKRRDEETRNREVVVEEVP